MKANGSEESGDYKENQFLTETGFDELKLNSKLLTSLNKAGFTKCTEIQSKVLPISLEGKDIAGQSQTGTGKTGAFLITVLDRLSKTKGREKGAAFALIIAPTRELAHQIFEDAEILNKKLGFKIANIVGGIDYQKQSGLLKEGADIVICTPGRIIDYIKQNIFKTSDIRMLVIDEADRLFDLGFTKDMQFILKRLPSYKKRQTMLFSATLSYRVMELTYEYMNLPEFISATPGLIAVKGVKQTLMHVEKEEKFSLLLGILDREKPTRVLIFVNTKAGVQWLAKKLKGNSWQTEAITGDLPQSSRFKIMEKFKKGKIKILIATDVASRGIHVEDVSHVINYDLPQDPENYIHRIGRTARAGSTGMAISIACEEYVYNLELIEKLLDYKIPVVWPEDIWFLKDKTGHIKIETKKPAKKKTAKTGHYNSRAYTITNRPSNYFPGTFFGFASSKKGA